MQLSRGNFKQDSITHVLLRSQSPSEYADKYNYHKPCTSPTTVIEYGKSRINSDPHFNLQINIISQCHIFKSFKQTSPFLYFVIFQEKKLRSFPSCFSQSHALRNKSQLLVSCHKLLSLEILDFKYQIEVNMPLLGFIFGQST